ncbi:MAG: MFS transporter [Planctomycetota bacterium]
MDSTKLRQWVELGAAALMHATSDAFAGVLPVAMPLISEHFNISKARGIFLLGAFGIACNWGQILVGHLRPHNERPLFAPIGLVLLMALCFVPFVPQSEAAWLIVFPIAVATGLGVAFTHPEGLRIAHGLDRLPGAMSTTVFLQGGFVGFAAAGVLAGQVLERTGLTAIAAFAAGPILALVLLYSLRPRLAVEGNERDAGAAGPGDEGRPNFWAIMTMSVPTATATALIVNLLPMQGQEIGFGLSYGGTAMALIGVGSAVGSFLWAALARSRGELRCSTAALLAGLPFLVLYQLLVRRPYAVWFLGLAGLGSFAAFPLLVSQAHHARGLNLGGRMALVIGGSWGIAGLALMGLGGLAESVGVRTILNFAWTGHLVSGATGIALILTSKPQTRR